MTPSQVGVTDAMTDSVAHSQFVGPCCCLPCAAGNGPPQSTGAGPPEPLPKAGYSWASPADPAAAAATAPACPAGKDGNKHIGLNLDRIKYWLSVGAQPSATVSRLLGQAGVVPRPPLPLHKGAVKNPDKYKKA